MENSLNSHGSEPTEDDDSNNENFSINGDEYEDFVVMCPACGQAFSTESERLAHDFDNCTGAEPIAKSRRVEDEIEESYSNEIGDRIDEFTDDIMSLQSEYGTLYDNNNSNNNKLYNNCNKSHNSITDKTRDDLKPQFMQAPLIPLLPKPSIKSNSLLKFGHNGIGASFPISKQVKDQFSNNYFHFKKNELQSRGKDAKEEVQLKIPIPRLKQKPREEEHITAAMLAEKMNGVKPYECDECGRVFVNLQGLSHHKVTHNGSKPYACYCGRSYTTVGNLKAHQKTHSGIKPYSCEECSKTFTTKQGLIYHRTLHTGNTPYKCDECGKSYSYSVALNAHKKTHLRLRMEAENTAALYSMMPTDMASSSLTEQALLGGI